MVLHNSCALSSFIAQGLPHDNSKKTLRNGPDNEFGTCTPVSFRAFALRLKP